VDITDVKIRQIKKEGKLKGVASITFDNEFVVHDIKIIQSERGLFVVMPSRKSARGIFKNIAHPISTSAREKVESSIIEKFKDSILEEVSSEVAADVAN